MGHDSISQKTTVLPSGERFLVLTCQEEMGRLSLGPQGATTEREAFKLLVEGVREGRWYGGWVVAYRGCVYQIPDSMTRHA